MTFRGLFILLMGITLLLVGLSSGSASCALLGTVACMTFLLTLLSTVISLLSFRCQQELKENEVLRQEPCTLYLSFRMFSLFPPAPLGLEVHVPSGHAGAYTVRLRYNRKTGSTSILPCPHVGTYSVGITQCDIHDVFGLFHFVRHLKQPLLRLTVLPQAAPMSPVPLHQGSEDGSVSTLSSMDHDTPEGIRAWVDGDEMKQVHWKLSAKRQTLLVRTYEQLQRPDTLILINGSVLSVPAPRRASIFDLLTESCAGIIANLLRESRPICLAIPELNMELRGANVNVFPDAQHMLASLPSGEPDHFPRVLELAAPRLLRTNTVLIFSASITPAIVDSVIHLARFGSSIRFTLACHREIDANERKLLQMLVAENVETFQVALS